MLLFELLPFELPLFEPLLLDLLDPLLDPRLFDLLDPLLDPRLAMLASRGSCLG